MAQEGTVEIRLNGEAVILRSSLQAAKMINTMGGLRNAITRVENFDLEAIGLVIAATTGKETIDEINATTAACYENGLIELQAPCLKIVNIIANGGREVKPLDPKKAQPTANPSSR